MRYYKWMFEDDPIVHIIPGFVFVSIDDAVRYSDEFASKQNPTLATLLSFFYRPMFAVKPGRVDARPASATRKRRGGDSRGPEQQRRIEE